MKFLEELMNILFQEYGGLLLTLVSIVLSIIAMVVFMGIVKNNIILIKKLEVLIREINGVIE
ncbi:MAG: hypothetical protein ACP5GY_06900 [Vulcanisaeta sp.]